MAITRWQQRGPFERFLNRWQDDIDQWFGSALFKAPDGDWMPAVDIEEEEGKYLLHADLPGVKKEDVHVELQNGYLTISGERKAEHEEKRDQFRRIERTYGSFQRSFKVPDGVTEKDITAQYRDGVLDISVPALESRQTGPKAIPIK